MSNTQDASVSIMDYYEPSKCVLGFVILWELRQAFIHSLIHSFLHSEWSSAGLTLWGAGVVGGSEGGGGAGGELYI